MKHRLKSLVAVSMLLAAASAGAVGLVGTSVRGTLRTVQPATVQFDQTRLVGPGIEFSFFGSSASSFTADIDDATITLRLSAGATTSLGTDMLWVFEFAPQLSFSSVTETADNFSNGVSVAQNTGNLLSFRIANFSYQPGSSFVAAYAVSAVPEPLSAWLAGVGLAGLAARLRWRFRRSTGNVNRNSLECHHGL